VENGMPEIVSATINLRPNERLCDAMDNLKLGLKRRGLSTAINWTGVEVPARISGKSNKHQRHGHVAIQGIEVHSVEWVALQVWLKGRNRKLPRSVHVKPGYSLEGLVGYFLCYRNFGVKGARIPVARGPLFQRASVIAEKGIEVLMDAFVDYSTSSQFANKANC
jgi:hypothetical protein